jgi:hypothetical protein
MQHVPSSIPLSRVTAPLLCACSLLGACATDSQAPHAVTAIPAPASATAALASLSTPIVPTTRPAREPLPRNTITPLDYYQWALQATPQELRAEQLRLATRADSADPVIATVHLGILMSVSALASRESERAALALLESLAAPGTDSDSAGGREYAIFADFLLEHLKQRADLRAATSNVVESREQLETLQRDNRQLQEKIEALTSIEEQIIEREQAEGEDE